MENTEQSQRTILIVEDDERFRAVYRDVLEGDGYRVLEAGDGETGLNTATTEQPDLLLLDLMLPSIDGFEVIERLRKDQKTAALPILVFSVLGQPEDIQKALTAGASDYTVKGFYSPREILAKIRALLMKEDVRSGLASYAIQPQEGMADAAKLQQDIGFTKSFICPDCSHTMVVELFPDYTRTEGHWFTAHFVCPNCKRAF